MAGRTVARTVAQTVALLVGAGLASSLVGIGLARFAYSPLLPAIIEAGWFGAGTAAYLGAANFAGYLAGALLGARLTHAIGPPWVLRLMMLLASLAFLGCAWPLNFPWYFTWRFASGFAGGVLMVVTAPTLLAHVPAERRGLAGGIMFAGIGIGIVASGTLVPPLVALGLREAWLALGLTGLVLTALTWRLWPQDGPGLPQASAALPKTTRRSLGALYLTYALDAVALVPHMVFLVDYVARGLGRGLAAGAEVWIVFGIGAAFGPVLAGALADRIGFAMALRLALVLQGMALAWVSLSPTGLFPSALIVGAFVPGIVPLVLGRVQELVPADPALRRRAWSLGTASFALGQAGGAYALSYLFANGVSYEALFAIGAASAMLALAVDLANRLTTRPD